MSITGFKFPSSSFDLCIFILVPYKLDVTKNTSVCKYKVYFIFILIICCATVCSYMLLFTYMLVTLILIFLSFWLINFISNIHTLFISKVQLLCLECAHKGGRPSFTSVNLEKQMENQTIKTIYEVLIWVNFTCNIRKI